jgi:hypothetical protein
MTFALRVLGASLVVGLILALLGIDPVAIIRDTPNAIARLFDLGVDAVAWAVPYVLTGAVIVVPIAAVILLRKQLSRRRPPPPPMV